jgi:hypothetical protein
VRFALLHSEIESDGGRGAEQQDGETQAIIGFLGTITGCGGMNWLKKWNARRRSVEEAVSSPAARG